MKIRERLGEELYNYITQGSIVGNPNRGLMGKKSLKVAFLGGSVTYGYCPDEEKCGEAFPYLVKKHLDESYPDSEVLNLGISGTACLMGTAITELILHDFSPDLMFIEYAINEELSRKGATYFEGLIRKLLSLPSKPVLIPVCVCSKDGYSCSELVRDLCGRYGLLCADLKERIYPLFGGRLDWSEYSCDEGHPIKEGAVLIADIAICAIERIMHTPQEDTALPSPQFPQAETYRNARLCGGFKTNFTETDKGYFCFPKSYVANGAGSFLELTEECSFAAAVFVISNDKALGTAVAETDGNEVTSLQGYSIFGWENPVVQELFCYSEKRKRKIRISLPKSESGKKFILLGVMVG